MTYELTLPEILCLMLSSMGIPVIAAYWYGWYSGIRRGVEDTAP